MYPTELTLEGRLEVVHVLLRVHGVSLVQEHLLTGRDIPDGLVENLQGEEPLSVSTATTLPLHTLPPGSYTANKAKFHDFFMTFKGPILYFKDLIAGDGTTR